MLLEDLEYIDETHTYLWQGVIIPSVTQILQKKFGGIYAHVDKDVLEKAASHGTEVHKAIEDYCLHGTESEYGELRDFRFLQKHYGFEVLGNELAVVLPPYCAGRLDMVLRDKEGRLSLADIKTTSSYEKEYVAYQLNIYRKAYETTYGGNIEALYCVHLRDYGKQSFRHFRKVPLSDVPIKWLEEVYEA